MREGWQTLTGEDLTTKITKGSSPKWQGFEYQSDGVLFVTSENVRDGFLDVSKPKFLPIEFSQKARNSRLNYEDILVNIVGASIGRACQFNLKGVEANVNQAVCVLRLKPEFESQFVLYLLQAPHVQRRLLGERSDSARPNLSLTDFREFSLDLPPLPEQRKIAGILRTWDRAIETVEALIANARAQKQALMQQLLPQGTTPPRKRLPGFSGEWKQRTVTQLGRVESGGTPASGNPTYWGGDIAWVTPGEITKQQTRHLATTERTITKDGLAESSTKLLPAGSVIVCTRATVGELAIATGPITTNQGFKNIVPSDRHDSDFIYYLLLHNKKALNRVAAGSTFTEVSKADFERLTFIVPVLEGQRAIAGILIDSDETIHLRSTQLAALRREKVALMQQLLTGKRRVKVDDDEVAA